MDRTSRPARKNARLPRLFRPERLATDTELELEPKPMHYLLDVMRGRVGDRVRLFNGRDGEWLARIATAGRRRCRLAVTEQTRPQIAEIGPTLLFAPIKKAGLEMLVEKATELGVGILMPVQTQRSIVDRLNMDRLRAIAIEAAEQSERLTVPEIQELQTLEQAAGSWPDSRPLYVADETGGGIPLIEAVEPARPAAFLIGPEGGFDPAELEWLGGCPAVVRVDLGMRILRAETAGIMVLACWAARPRAGPETTA